MSRNSEEFVEKRGLAGQAVEIVGQAMVTDMRSTFDSHTARDRVGADMSTKAADAVYAQAGLAADDIDDIDVIDVIELHDCFSANELLTYEALGLAEVGEGHELIGTADERQVAGAKVALQHNIGLGGAAVVTAYRLAEH